MNALILGANLPGTIHGGAEVYAEKLSAALRAIGYSVEFVLPNHPARASDLLIINGSQGVVALWADHWVQKAQAVWIIPHDSLPTYINNNGWYWRRLLDQFVLYPLLKAKLRKLIADGAKIIAGSPINAQELQQDFGVEAVLIPYGVEHLMPQFTQRLKPIQAFKQRFALLGGFVGRWDVTKNPEELVKLIKECPAEVGLVMRSSPDGIYKVGPWPPLQHPNVIWLEGLERPELYGLYSLLDFLLLPSRYEGFGYAAVEAASAGAIPFVTPTGLGDHFSQHPSLKPLVLHIPPFGTESTQEVWQKVLQLKDPGKAALYRQALTPVVREHGLEQWEKRIQELARSTVVSCSPLGADR